jgi:hypothetical protein
LATLGFGVFTVVAIGDYMTTRMKISAARALATRGAWEAAGASSLVGSIGLLAAGRALSRSILERKIAVLMMVLLTGCAIGFAVTRWISPTPALVPFFNGGLLAVPASMLFVVTSRK